MLPRMPDPACRPRCRTGRSAGDHIAGFTKITFSSYSSHPRVNSGVYLLTGKSEPPFFTNIAFDRPQVATKGPVGRIMMISIGNKHFIESQFIVEIQRAADTRRNILAHLAAGTGMLIDASEGRRIKSIIKLKTRHIVLSALGVETLKSRLAENRHSAVSGNRVMFKGKPKKKSSRPSRSPEVDDRRIEPDRRHFSYTYYVPERRSGTERRNKNGDLRRE
jgi:extracellular matrix regulatory protein A